MLKNRLIFLALLCPSISHPMDIPNTTIDPKENKNTQTTPEIKPFTTAQEEREEFYKLGQQEAIGIANTDNYRKDLIHFYQRLFKTIVKKDIEKKIEYTIALGFKSSNNGNLTMELLPVTSEDAPKYNRLLFKLSIDQTDKTALEELKIANAQRANPSKSAESFFPNIVILENDTTKLESKALASYCPTENIILTRKKQLSIVYCEAILHEFVHRRQLAQGTTAKGGEEYGLLDSEGDYRNYPGRVAIEVEADLYSTKEHPYPDFFLEIAKDYTKREKNLFELACQLFPYMTYMQRYIVICRLFNLNDDQECSNIANKSAKKLIKYRGKIITTCLNYCKGENNTAETDFPVCLALVKKSVESTEKFEKQTQEIKSDLLTNKNLSPEQRNKIIEASNYQSGSNLFFALQQRLGIIPKISIK